MAAGLAAVLLGAIDLTVISTVLPEIVFDLGINTADIDRYIWVVNAYLIAYIVAIPIVGRFSDIAGRSVAFFAALLVFAAGSVWAGFAESLGSLIAARALQGAGGGALLPLALALAGDLPGNRARTSAIGLVGAVDTFGWVIGPLWGAAIVALLDHESGAWRWVFWSNVPLAIAIAAIASRSLSPAAPRSQRGLRRLDIPGALLLGGGLTALTLGLSTSGEVGLSRAGTARAFGGTTNPMADRLPLLLAAAAVLLSAFLWRQRRATEPLIPRSLIASARLKASLLANLVIGAALIVAVVNVPITVALLESEERVSSISAALMAPFALLVSMAALAGGVAADRVGDRRIAIVGIILSAAGYVVLWAVTRESSPATLLPGLALAGAGLGLTMSPATGAALHEANDTERGVAAASAILFRLLGMTLSLSALTSFGVRRLQSLTSDINPVVRREEETTAEFFLRQNAYIQEVAIPLAIQVVRETFLIAAVLVVIALIPSFRFRQTASPEP